MLLVLMEYVAQLNERMKLSLLGRPTYTSADLYILPLILLLLLLLLLSFFLSFFFYFFAQLVERNSTKIGYMLGSKCDLKTHVQNLGYPLLLQIGGPKTTFFDDFATYRQI